jgi:hypothetical protein
MDQPKRLAERVRQSVEERRLQRRKSVLLRLSQQGWQALGSLAERYGESPGEVVERALQTLAAQAPEKEAPVTAPAPAPAVAPPSPPAPKPDVRQRIQSMRAAGLSLRAIAEALNREGVPTLSGSGTWDKGKLSKLLSRLSAQRPAQAS